MSGGTVLVTGANGFLGNATTKAFSLEGWTTYGLLRSQKAVSDLVKHEIIPVIGTAADTSWLQSLPDFDVIVSTTGNIDNASDFDKTIAMFRLISTNARRRGGKKPLVIFTSGCKDYGTTKKHGEPGLKPHTEDDPLRPPVLVAPRTKNAATIFDHVDDFDAVLTRPTTMYGHSGSYYAGAFAVAEQAKAAGQSTLNFAASPRSILHGTHVDDVAAAYVWLACAPREVVAGQTYNISGYRYETLHEVSRALEQSYGLTVTYSEPTTEHETDILDYLVNFSQWVGSEKLRKDIGWMDKKKPFSEGFEVYRLAYEQAVRDRDEGAIRIANQLSNRKLREEEQSK